MNRIQTIFGAAALLAGLASSAWAEPACWTAPELRSYDITMQTLLLAHVAAACDALAPATPPLKTGIGQFLDQHQPQLNQDRESLAGFYRRAYGDDWQSPMEKSLNREDTRVTAQVTQTANPDFCKGAAGAMRGLATEPWDKFVADAQAAGWHGKAGFPACQ